MITYADFTFDEIIANYQASIISYPIFSYILVATILLGIIIFINIPNKTAFNLTLITNILLVVCIFYFRGLDMFNQITTIFNSYFYQNIFFYYWNVIIGMIVMNNAINNNKESKLTKFIIIVINILTITNLIFSLYITHILDNNLILLVGNIASMIVIGNIILFVLYLYVIMLKIVKTYKVKR